MKLKPAYETHVFINALGYLCIGQKNPDCNTQDLVMLNPAQAELVCQETRRLLKSQTEWWQMDYEAPDIIPTPTAKPPAFAGKLAS